MSTIIQQISTAAVFVMTYLKKNALMVIGLVLSSILLFYNAVRISMPLGYGGLFALMAEQVSLNNFVLPTSIPYYGPGGIPFAYPPLGFYVMALALRLDISYITYLRFFPSFCTLISLIPLFFLVRKYTESGLAATIAIIYVASSPASYVMHAWSAGAVRALALVLMLCGIYFLEMSRKEDGLRYAILAGIFCGLTCLTHLFYGMFLALWVVALVGIHLRSFSTRKLLVFSIAGVLTAAPWVYVMVSRYGLDVFSNALFSHDNFGFFGLVQVPNQFFGWMLAKISTVVSFPLAYLAIGLGLVKLLVARQYTVPVVSAMSLLLLPSGGDRFIVLLVSIMLGASVMNSKLWIGSNVWPRYILAGLTFFSLMLEAVTGIRTISIMGPGLDASAFQVAEYVHQNTPLQSRYLFVTGQTEAEWFPYLLQRDPLVSTWGSEWLGTYDEQGRLQSQVSTCRDIQSVDCLRRLHVAILPDDVLITRKAQRRLSAQLEMDSRCVRMATLGRYIIWKAQCLAD